MKIVPLINLRYDPQAFQLVLDHNSRSNICKDDCPVSGIVQPDTLDPGWVYDRLAEKSELKLLVYFEEFALNDSEAAAGKSRSAHEPDNIVGRERMTMDNLCGEGETVKPGFKTLLLDSLEVDLGFIGMLEYYASISPPIGFIDTKADAML